MYGKVREDTPIENGIPEELLQQVRGKWVKLTDNGAGYIGTIGERGPYIWNVIDFSEIRYNLPEYSNGEEG